jgi:8-oxo-dGTP pyrophosphatase MutT (NUDIX family)
MVYWKPGTYKEVAMKTPRVIGRQTLVESKKYSYDRLTVEDASGGTFTRDMVHHPGAVLVVPILGDGRLVLIRNYRICVEQWLLEFCAGTIDLNETPAQCAGRELVEETGYQAERLTPLGSFYTSPGVTDERMQVFAATELTQVGQKLEPDELIEVVQMTSADVMVQLEAGKLIDGKSIAGLLMACRRGLISHNKAGETVAI